MATNTPNLNLLKKDPATDGNETFNIKTMLNDNWDKIDAAVGNISIPDATTTVKGKVQLSNATDSDSEAMAATPKAVKDVSLQAKSYTDQQINLVTATGIPKLVSYPLKVTATVDNQTVFEIPLDLFDANTDTLMVAINRATLDSTQYTVTNTVRNQAGEVTQRAKITLLSGVTATSEVTMVVLKNVPIGKDGSINGAVLAADSVPINRVSGLQEKLDAQLVDLVLQVPGKGASLVGVADSDGLFTATNVEGALKEAIQKANSAFQSASDGKAAVAAAITGKGVSASGSDTFSQLAGKIGQIVTGKRYAEVNIGNIGANEERQIDVGFSPKIVTINNQTQAGTKFLTVGIVDIYGSFFRFMSSDPYAAIIPKQITGNIVAISSVYSEARTNVILRAWE